MIKIMIVEDHAIVRDGLAEMLSKQRGMNVVGTAVNGKDALITIGNGLAVDLVLTDFKMPVMSGLELTKKIIALNIGLRIIMLTVHTNDTLKRTVLAAGADYCFFKEGDINELYLAINKSFLTANSIN